MSSVARRTLAWRVLQLVLVAIVLWYVVRQLSAQWDRVWGTISVMRPNWVLLLLASGIVLVTYALLIQTWRLVLRRWNAELSFGSAARIWFVSNLGKYVPGKIWQITAMGVMARNRGVSPVAAAGSSLLLNLLNVIAGFAVVFLSGAGVLAALGERQRSVALVLTIVLFAGVLLTPLLLKVARPFLERRLGREVALPEVPLPAVLLAMGASALAWVMYGVAFRLFAVSLFGHVYGGLGQWIAVYSASYLVGYLALFVPGGIGVRETMLVTTVSTLGMLGVSGSPGAWALALASRLWLTVLEILPGLLFALWPDRPEPSSNEFTDAPA